jgi:hypothetical protein
MNFNANYVTKDGWFEVMLDKSTLIKPQETNYIPNWKSKEITDLKITVYNTMTDRLSDKSIYYNEKKGFYFKGNSSYWNKTPHSKYYINDLIKKED